MDTRILAFRAPGYNTPYHLAMFWSQWAHDLFLRDEVSYDEYVETQNGLYEIPVFLKTWWT